MAGRKIFVGSLPDGIQEGPIRVEFEKFGEIEDIYIKANAEPGRQWAFVTYTTAQAAIDAKEATDRTLKLPGTDRAIEVMLARNQGGRGDPPRGDMSGMLPSSSTGAAVYLPPAMSSTGGPKKIFCGSLPDSITETELREEFSKYGTVTDLHLKTGQDKGKSWAFISFATTDEANLAKSSTDRVLTFPGGDKPCEVMLARHQGMNGQEPIQAGVGHGAVQGPCKVFVGSLPDNITETVLRAEFSKFGEITDVYLKTGCDTGKQWAFLMFANHAQAQNAKDTTDRVLVFPGAAGPCETMFAKNQGRNGQDPVSTGSSAPGQYGFGAQQPPPPNAPMPPHLNPWRCYYTTAGLPYYYNHMTAVTQWEMPAEFQMMQAASPYGPMAMHAPAQQYAAMAAQAQAHAAAQAQAAHAMYYGAMYPPAAGGHGRYGPF